MGRNDEGCRQWRLAKKIVTCRTGSDNYVEIIDHSVERWLLTEEQWGWSCLYLLSFVMDATPSVSSLTAPPTERLVQSSRHRIWAPTFLMPSLQNCLLISCWEGVLGQNWIAKRFKGALLPIFTKPAAWESLLDLWLLLQLIFGLDVSTTYSCMSLNIGSHVKCVFPLSSNALCSAGSLCFPLIN